MLQTTRSLRAEGVQQHICWVIQMPEQADASFAPVAMTRLNRDFFARETLTVARELLGQRLVRVLNGMRLSGRIVEVEAYIGEEDQASHARSGRTERNASMYGPPGQG